MKYVATLNGKRYEVEIERVEEYRPLTAAEIASGVTAPAKPVVAAPVEKAAPAPAAAPVAPAPTPAAPVEKAAPAASGNGETVVSPLPGTVLDVKVNVGDTVKLGQVVVVLEAMKMETEVVAGCDGTVESILIKKGDAVDTDAALVVLK